jgi:hypothetical protein
MKRPSSSSSPSNIRSKAKPKPKPKPKPKIEPKPQTTVRAVALAVTPNSHNLPNPRASVKKATTSRKASPPASHRSKTPSSAALRRTPKATRHQDCAASPASATSVPRAQSKQAQLIYLLGTSSGASMAQMIALTGWQAHTVRGAISGALRKRLGLNVQTHLEEGARVYRLHRAKGEAGL